MSTENTEKKTTSKTVRLQDICYSGAGTVSCRKTSCRGRVWRFPEILAAQTWNCTVPGEQGLTTDWRCSVAPKLERKWSLTGSWQPEAISLCRRSCFSKSSKLHRKKKDDGMTCRRWKKPKYEWWSDILTGIISFSAWLVNKRQQNRISGIQNDFRERARGWQCFIHQDIKMIQHKNTQQID